MISKTAQYALRAIVFLASQDGRFSTRTTIADATQIPLDYLLKVLNELDTHQLVESRRGPGGGYRMTGQPEKMSALQVVLAVDSIPRISQCPLRISKHEQLCPLHQLLDDASRQVESAFGNTSIADLVPGRKRSTSCSFPRKN